MSLRDSIRRAARALVPRAAVNALLRWVRAALGARRFDSMMGRGHRAEGYRMLSGRGIEIGALHAPAVLPVRCAVTYVDAMSTAEAARLFPEVDAHRLVPVDIVADMDRDGLSAVDDASYDFAVMNHVIEHVANPVKAIEELFRVVRPGGFVVLSAPDMRFSFDRSRLLTSDEHLLAEYAAGVSAVSDDHYEEFVRAVVPGASDPAEFERQVAEARRRREHAHVWNSSSFERFLGAALSAAGVQAWAVYRSDGDANRLEHFSVWEKQGLEAGEAASR